MHAGFSVFVAVIVDSENSIDYVSLRRRWSRGRLACMRSSLKVAALSVALRPPVRLSVCPVPPIFSKQEVVETSNSVNT